MATGRPSVTALRRLSDRTPLRTKLITSVLALVIVALAAIGVASVVMLRGYVTTQRDNDLRASFGQYLTGDPIPRDVQPGFATLANSGMVFALQQPGHQVSWITGGFTGGNQEPLPQLPTSANWATAPGGVLVTTSSRSGPDTWRLAAKTAIFTVIDPNTGPRNETLTFIVAIDLGNLGAMTRQLAVFELIVGGLIVVVLAAVGVAVVRSNLRPLNDIELTAGQIAAGHLNHRIPERDPRTEVGSLGRSLNAMLSQIEAAFHAQEESEQAAHASEERMRRFIADASHELRTPLTTIRGFAAHYRQRGGVGRGVADGGPADGVPPSGTADQDQFPGTGAASADPGAWVPGGVATAAGMSPADVDHLMSRVEAEATRMGLLVEDLLTLARLDQQRPLTVGPVDLLTLAVDAVHDARIVSPERSINLLVAPGAAFLVNGDEPRLRQVLGNLLNNALTHTPAGTPVRVRIGPGTLAVPGGAGGGAHGAGNAGGATAAVVPAVVLDVEDDGPGMTTEQAQRVFERFYRADAARNRSSGGTGLGLAIVAGLVAAHGGTVSVRTAPGAGADFQVRLPLAPDAQLAGPEDSEDEDG